MQTIWRSFQDKRQVDLEGGRQRLKVADVSAQIRPETVSLAANSIAIVEQNFDFDLLTPGKLMEKAVGGVVCIVRVGPATGEGREQAQVLATNGEQQCSRSATASRSCA